MNNPNRFDPSIIRTGRDEGVDLATGRRVRIENQPEFSFLPIVIALLTLLLLI